MTKPTIVLVPGLGSDAAVWRRTIAALGDDARCIVGDTLSDSTLPAMARRILAQAPKRFVLAGVSMGGMVALEIMRAEPQRVIGLALLDTNARPDTGRRRLSRRLANLVVRFTKDFRSRAERSVEALVHPAASSDVKAELAEMSVRVGSATYIRQNRAVGHRQDLRPVLSGIAVPTFVAVGEQDGLTPPVLSREIAAGVPGSTLRIIPDCGHLPPIERPEATADLLRKLINSANIDGCRAGTSRASSL